MTGHVLRHGEARSHPGLYAFPLTVTNAVCWFHYFFPAGNTMFTCGYENKAFQAKAKQLLIIHPFTIILFTHLLIPLSTHFPGLLRALLAYTEVASLL